MASLTAAGARWLFVFLFCTPVLASPPEDLDLPKRWQVQADGWSGTLELRVEPSGGVSGTLQDQTVSGFLAGRHLVLRRTMGDRDEVWEGWLSEDSRSSQLFVAGSVTVGDGGPVHPWYAVPEPRTDLPDPPVPESKTGISDPAVPEAETAPPDPAVPAPKESTASEPADVPTTEGSTGGMTSAAASAGEAPSPTEPPAGDQNPISPPGSDQESTDLSGVWIASEGRAEIFQQGRDLEVVLPDGTRHQGRFTAIDTIVVGLRKGCCKGTLKDPDQISWSDMTVWRRAD